jgi:arsenite methyltransferase
MKNVPGLMNRPGGFTITDRALEFCSFKTNSMILDLGCGSGATIEHLQQKYGFVAFGLDKNLKTCGLINNLMASAAEEIPFPAKSVDGVLMECSLSVMDSQTTVLKECNRVLKPDGRLIISDLYSRGEPAKLQGFLGYIHSKEYLVALVEEYGFTIEHFQDFTGHLQSFWGQMIFDQGAQAFYCSLGVEPEIFRRIKCGYFLMVAKKKGDL